MKNERVEMIKNLGDQGSEELDRQQSIFDETYNLVIGKLEKEDPERAVKLKEHREKMLAITEAGKKGDFDLMEELSKNI